MFPDDTTDSSGDHDAAGPDEKCLGCGHYHGDISEETSAFLRDISGGYISTWQVLTAVRGLVTQLRQLVPADLAALLLVRELHIVEDWLRDNDYTVPTVEGGRAKFLTAEARMENAAELQELLDGGVPDFIPDDLGGSNEQ